MRHRRIDLLGRIAIVHDYLTQRGGAERVALELLRCFPGAPIITSVYNAAATYPEFAEYEIIELLPSRTAGMIRDTRHLFPLMPLTFDRTELRGAEVVICSSSGWAHRIRTEERKVVYCHNPPRWLYQTQEYIGLTRVPWRRGWNAVAARLIASDRVAAAGSDVYIANSRTVATRIKQVYGIQAKIIHPPAGIRDDGLQESIGGVRPGFLLAVARSRGYKNLAVLVRAMEQLPNERLVVLTGSVDAELLNMAPRNVRFLSNISDEKLRWLYRSCTLVVAVAFEDFGLTPVEGFHFGRPCVALHAGGYLDSVEEGVNGLFVDDLSPLGLAGTIRSALRRSWNHELIVRSASRFSPQSFCVAVRNALKEETGNALSGEEQLENRSR